MSYSASNADWTEDFGHENGNYENICLKCDIVFRGHKRRSFCRVCAPPTTGEARPLNRTETDEDDTPPISWLVDTRFNHDTVETDEAALSARVDERRPKMQAMIEEDFAKGGFANVSEPEPEVVMIYQKDWDHLKRERDELRAALEKQLDRTIDLIQSGDCGFWDPNEDPDVAAMRDILARITV